MTWTLNGEKGTANFGASKKERSVRLARPPQMRVLAFASAMSPLTLNTGAIVRR